MATVTVEEVKSHFSEVIAKTPPGVGILITQDGEPVAELFRLSTEKPQAVAGRCKGMLTILSEDDDHLADWKDYLP